MIHYRLATVDDNKQLLELTAAAGMAGETSLRIDRKPDFFKLLELRGETRVFVAVDNDNIIGSICVSRQNVYLGKEIFPVHYIGDFKVAASYRNKGIGLQLCNEMADYVIAAGADLAFLNVSKGNNKPISFFKNRPHIPDFENIGIFHIHQFIGKKIKAPKYKIEPAELTEEVLQFMDKHYSQYELGTVIDKRKLEATDVYIIRNHTRIIAAMCLMNTMNIKQNVVTRFSWKMKFILKFMNIFSVISGTSKMPVLHEPVRMIYIRYLAVDKYEKDLAQALINYARHIAFEKSYSFASIGLHEKDPLNNCFRGLFKLTFNSVGMLLSIKNNKTLIEKVKQGIPFEDYSLV